MGINFSHGEARFSYSGFNDFREMVAKSVGIELRKMEGFGSFGKDGVWGEMPWPDSDDPIMLLLDHSDCDGDIDPEDCGAIADRLEEIVRRWPTDDMLVVWDKERGHKLARGLREAGESGERFVFC